jgi:hypothetical protein
VKGMDEKGGVSLLFLSSHHVNDLAGKVGLQINEANCIRSFFRTFSVLQNGREAIPFVLLEYLFALVISLRTPNCSVSEPNFLPLYLNINGCKIRRSRWNNLRSERATIVILAT